MITDSCYCMQVTDLQAMLQQPNNGSMQAAGAVAAAMAAAAGAEGSLAPEINRWDLIQRGAGADS